MEVELRTINKHCLHCLHCLCFGFLKQWETTGLGPTKVGAESQEGLIDVVFINLEPHLVEARSDASKIVTISQSQHVCSGQNEKKLQINELYIKR